MTRVHFLLIQSSTQKYKRSPQRGEWSKHRGRLFAGYKIQLYSQVVAIKFFNTQPHSAASTCNSEP